MRTWITVLTVFYYSCYSPTDLEVIYEDEGLDHIHSYSYGPDCGITVHDPSDVNDIEYGPEPEPYDERRDEPDEPVFIPWKLF